MIDHTHDENNDLLNTPKNNIRHFHLGQWTMFP